MELIYCAHESEKIRNKYEIKIKYRASSQEEDYYSFWVCPEQIEKTILEIEAFDSQFYFAELNGDPYLFKKEFLGPEFKWLERYPTEFSSQCYCCLLSYEVFYHSDTAQQYKVQVEQLDTFRLAIDAVNRALDNAEYRPSAQEYLHHIDSLIEKHLLDNTLESKNILPTQKKLLAKI